MTLTGGENLAVQVKILIGRHLSSLMGKWMRLVCPPGQLSSRPWGTWS